MITEKKHTPGPWVLNQYGNIIDAKGDQVLASGLAMAAGYRPKHDVAFINARLIAAAPELLEALEELPLDAFKEDGEDADAADFVDNARHFVAAMDKARAAIAKALGQ